ncbi:hypothetical protein FUAX_46190 (plasmid) [Fulvitalea axinellae]|uniref:SusD/RagB family nutrient-binding outer membrane lipoprotein n=1 Tax=Fulvitalea axinellae TaxID=1182444 RepID=A0AAU9D3R8_9BACT|nr:hypothetical protein FUAX_46190 [Fulvitalea axinellae]
MKGISPRFIVLFLVVACTSGFEKINDNPNDPTTVPPEDILADVIIQTAYSYQEASTIGPSVSASRYFTKIRNETDDLFNWTGVSWRDQFKALSNNQNLLDMTEGRKDLSHLHAIGLIIKSFNFSYLTDLYGDIPYSEALLSKDEDIIYPQYDSQEDIYKNIMADLTLANNMLSKPGELPESGDILYHGNALAWRKFANSLRLRMLIRMSGKVSVREDIQSMMDQPDVYPLILNNNDNASLPYVGTLDEYSWIFYNKRWLMNRYRPSKIFVDLLLRQDDPRLEAWLSPVNAWIASERWIDKNMYVGVPHAIPNPYEYNGGEDYISSLSDVYLEESHSHVEAMMINCCEVYFNLAEAVQRLGVKVPGNTDESLYYKGIRASMRQYGVEAEEKFFKSAEIAYNASFEQLIIQKWLSLWLTGAEGWFDHRRTGFPNFPIGERAVQRTIPLRFQYPPEEMATNEENYKKAIGQQGWLDDDINEKMWYLKVGD